MKGKSFWIPVGLISLVAALIALYKNGENDKLNQIEKLLADNTPQPQPNHKEQKPGFIDLYGKL